MKIPEHFIIRISTSDLGKGTYSSGRKIKDLFDKVPVNFSYAKNLYSGGRYSYKPEFICEVKLKENYLKEFTEIILLFKRK